MKHQLTLVRKSDDDAIFRTAAVAAGKVVLDKISWFMPHVLPADAEKFSLYKSIESKVSLPVAYRTRQCDTITVPESTLFSWRLGVKVARKTSLDNYRTSDGKKAEIKLKIRPSSTT